MYGTNLRELGFSFSKDACVTYWLKSMYIYHMEHIVWLCIYEFIQTNIVKLNIQV